MLSVSCLILFLFQGYSEKISFNLFPPTCRLLARVFCFQEFFWELRMRIVAVCSQLRICFSFSCSFCLRSYCRFGLVQFEYAHSSIIFYFHYLTQLLLQSVQSTKCTDPVVLDRTSWGRYRTSSWGVCTCEKVLGLLFGDFNNRLYLCVCFRLSFSSCLMTRPARHLEDFFKTSYYKAGVFQIWFSIT